MSDNQFDFGPAAKQIESLKGAANGLASLDSNGLVPSSQLPGATQSVAGLMSAADKTKLDGIATGATANVVSDSLSDTSTTNALSAAKGKALNDGITALNTQIALFGMKSKAFQLANATSATFDAWSFVLFGVKNSADNSNNRFCYYGTSIANNARGGYIGSDVSWVGITFNATTQKLTITNNGTSYGSFVLFYADT